MKKFLSLIIILVTSFMACSSSVMASFMMGDMDMKSMNHEGMMMGMWDEMKGMDCMSVEYQCCISPYEDSWLGSNLNIISQKKEIVKWKILDYSFLAIVQDSLSENYIERNNSPPWRRNIDLLNNFYLALVGNIKSNT